ncbi:MAG: adenylate/guanylate cyclase domain-containing protein, partial [Desulfobacterales bacterium]
MECPKCQFENPDGVNFCVECGGKLETICPKCGYRNSLSHKFCGGCGHKLSLPEAALPKDLSFDEKLTKIQRYLPKGLTEKILSQRDRIEGERKQVTVMFCDMEGFTQLSESLGAEEAYAIMDQVYEILIHKVHDYEGTVNEMTGDGIMALFGAPVALEDAPQRAIRAAHGIHREMSRFSDKIKQENENIPPLKMRIGIHTGPVVVGTLGNDLRVEFKAVGDTVNLASRMEGLAEPGSTYVTEDTYRRTEGLFRFEVLGDYSVKGRADTVKAYRVIAPSTRRTRFDVSAERGLTPFVGRERELDLLLDSFDYHPVLDILKSNFNIGEGDNDAEIGKKIKRGLKILAADEATTLPYLLELLSVKDSGIDKIMMSPEGRRDRIIEALKRIVLKGSGIRPLVMAIEDLHWADKSSEEVLKFLLESIPGTAVFLIFTYRPEFVHTWGGKSYHSQVNLNRLSNRESLAMLSHLLGAEDIDESIEELVLEKTEGVPFFIEEFIKSLKDLKVIEKKDSKYRLAKEIS